MEQIPAPTLNVWSYCSPVLRVSENFNTKDTYSLFLPEATQAHCLLTADPAIFVRVPHLKAVIDPTSRDKFSEDPRKFLVERKKQVRVHLLSARAKPWKRMRVKHEFGTVE